LYANKDFTLAVTVLGERLFCKIQIKVHRRSQILLAFK